VFLVFSPNAGYSFNRFYVWCGDELISKGRYNNSTPALDGTSAPSNRSGFRPDSTTTTARPPGSRQSNGTATVNEENQIRFLDDVYGYDAELEKALAAGYPYAW
jgi:hypothetical protein